MEPRGSISGGSYKDILIQAVHSLADSTGLEAAIEAIEPRLRVGADAIVNVSDESKRWRFYVEIKPHLSSHTLGPAIAAVTQIKKQHHSAALVSSYVNPSQAEKLRQLGIEFFDAAGNASFQQKGLHVFITGRKPQAQKSLGRPARAFNPTGSRLIFALLCQPGLENRPYREMAKEAGISLGAVNWIINDLKSLGHLVDLGARGRRLVNKKELLKRWTSAYPEQLRPKLMLGRFKTAQAPDWWQKADLPSDAFWGGEVAAKLLTKYLRPGTVTIYSETILPKLQARHGLVRDPNGEVELLRRFWKFDHWDEKNLQTAPPLLVYADLVSTADERCLETAEIIYEQYIAGVVT
ncbi:MAG TPA: type IV toxin-antitoxin system AbiEi family antitoxin [Pyrinomonadaceae bacterium]